MPEILAVEPQSMSHSTGKAEVVKTPKSWEIGHGLTKDDVPATPTREASLPLHAEHPDVPYKTGVGYAGGGYGQYRICTVCGTIFGKVEWPDRSDRRD